MKYAEKPNLGSNNISRTGFPIQKPVLKARNIGIYVPSDQVAIDRMKWLLRPMNKPKVGKEAMEKELEQIRERTKLSLIIEMQKHEEQRKKREERKKNGMPLLYQIQKQDS